jgi:glutaredoxin-like protein NrdH
MEQPAVKLYALSTCSHCRNTKRLLDESGVIYDCVDVDLLAGEERKTVIAEVKQLNPNLSFPVLLIHGTVIVGYKKEEILEALGT